MTDLSERVRRWRAVAAETQALLSHNDELLEERAQLLREASDEFRLVARLARVFLESAAGEEQDDLDLQEPAARSTSPRRR